ncbi:phasin [Hansschlegelia plantiphila]|uniref:Phasin domain-containing protein n=1 Tax=Hansschlegelia plantiphila TaxID=374655 RepID=A0A9W6MUS5_9HYPH|nr:phasin [Hansschlegelia plantiphila]GLK67198.1 hypothetical protein GCM10008179_08360 [Hansschlegelia plantiphila]
MVSTPKAAVKSEEMLNETLNAANKAAERSAAPVRELAEKSVQQAKEGYARFKTVAEEASDTIEDAVATTSKGYKELSRKSVEVARSNANAHFDFLHALVGAKTLSQAIELQTSYARQQFDVVSGQIKELSALAQKTATDGARPFQSLAGKGLSFPKI